MEFSYRQKLPYEKNLPAAAPTKTSSQNFPDLSREIPNDNRGLERIARNESQKILPGGRDVGRIAQNNSSPWRLPSKPATPQSSPKNVVDLKNIDQH